MFTPESVEKQLITIIAKSLQIPERNVRPESTLMIDLEAESIDILDIRFAIEQAFGFKFDTDEIRILLKNLAASQQLTEKDVPRLFTVGRLYEYVLVKIQQQHAPR